MRSLVLVCLAVSCCCALPALADVPADSMAGVWSSSTDPGGAIHISRPSTYGVIEIAGRTFHGAGFYDGRQVVAMTRTPDPRGTPFEPGVLRLKPRDALTIDAEFASDFKTSPSRREVWTRTGRFGVDATQKVSETASRDSATRVNSYDGEELPEAITKVPPSYPDEAREKKIQGTVMTQALVGVDGTVHDIKIIRSIPGLDEAAMAAVRQWRFKPGTKNGVPVALWVAIPVRFTLH